MCVRAAEDRRVQHPREGEIRRVARLAANPLLRVDALRALSHGRPRAAGPLLERVFLDDEPDLLEASFDLFLGADQSCHVSSASSILGYVPQRQRFPDIACRILSRDGFGFDSTSAAAETT